MPVRVRRRRGWRRGFTLVEVIVALAILLILAAVAVPQLNGMLDQKRIEEAATLLVQIRDALYGPSTSFRSHVGANAGRLSHLSTAIVNGDDDSCGGSYTGGERNNWPNGGPYVNFIIDPVAGMATPIGQADDDLIRVTSGGSTYSRITFTNAVSLQDAEALDLFVDGVAGWNAGTVRWTPQLGAGGVVTLHYFVVINSTC